MRISFVFFHSTLRNNFLFLEEILVLVLKVEKGFSSDIVLHLTSDIRPAKYIVSFLVEFPDSRLGWGLYWVLHMTCHHAPTAAVVDVPPRSGDFRTKRQNSLTKLYNV